MLDQQGRLREQCQAVSLVAAEDRSTGNIQLAAPQCCHVSKLVVAYGYLLNDIATSRQP